MLFNVLEYDHNKIHLSDPGVELNLVSHSNRTAAVKEQSLCINSTVWGERFIIWDLVELGECVIFTISILLIRVIELNSFTLEKNGPSKSHYTNSTLEMSVFILCYLIYM